MQYEHALQNSNQSFTHSRLCTMLDLSVITEGFMVTLLCKGQHEWLIAWHDQECQNLLRNQLLFQTNNCLSGLKNCIYYDPFYAEKHSKS